MNRYLDQLDTNRTVSVDISVRPLIDNGIPHCTILVNHNVLLDTMLDQATCVNYKANILDPINIVISMSNKQYNSLRETAIIVDSIVIDGIEIIPKFNHLVQYTNEKQESVFSNYMGFNGSWTLDINQPFYRWYHWHNSNGWLLFPLA